MRIITDQSVYRNLALDKEHLFLQPAWLDASAGPDHWSAMIAFNDRQEAIAAWPFQIQSKWGIRQLTAPPYTAYNDIIIFDANATDSIFKAFRQALPYASLAKIKQRSQQSLPCNLHKSRIRHSIPWQSALDSYSNRIQARKRSLIRKAHKNYSIHPSNNPEEWIAGLAGSIYRNNLKPLDLTILHRWNFHLNNILAWVVKDDQQSILGAMIAIPHRNNLYAIAGGRNYNTPSSGVMEALYWQLITWANQHQLDIDLCGSSLPGVSDFNRRMGAIELSYSQYIIARPNLLQHLLPK